MLASYSDKWTPDILPWIAILSGCFSILVLVLGLQKYMLFMPKSVFEGFTTAVGFIIGLKQINHACGMLDLPKVCTTTFCRPHGHCFCLSLSLTCRLIVERRIPAKLVGIDHQFGQDRVGLVPSFPTSIRGHVRADAVCS
eukprot:SAG31_NODE_1934_length_6875_cov_2.868506_2_plen_140_part_00